MTALLDGLLLLVQKHIDRYRELASLLDEEQSALIRLDVEQLQQLSKTKETMVLKIELLVEPLAQTIRDAARALGLPENPQPALAEIAEAAPRAYRIELRRRSFELVRLKNQIARHNEANRNFVRESIRLVSDSIAILTGAVAARKTGYLPNGQQPSMSGYRPVKLSREV